MKVIFLCCKRRRPGPCLRKKTVPQEIQADRHLLRKKFSRKRVKITILFKDHDPLVVNYCPRTSLTHRARETIWRTQLLAPYSRYPHMVSLRSCSESQILPHGAPYFTAENNHLHIDSLIFDNSKQLFDCLSVF